MAQSKFLWRLTKLMVAFFIYGFGIALMLKAGIGLLPWDVLAQGISKQGGVSFGIASVIVSIIVLLTWIPLKVKPGLGSVLNAIFIGLFVDVALPFVPVFDSYPLQLVMLMLGLVVVSFATGLYISCGMGKGPRDGLNLGLTAKLQRPFWQVRTGVEVLVVSVGFLLGGQVREGTLIAALSIGYLNQIFLKAFKLVDRDGKLDS